MKKVFIVMMILGVSLLVGCGKTQPAENTNNIIIEEETSEEITIVNDVFELDDEDVKNILKDMDKYSDEYIEELYYNTVYEVLSLNEEKFMKQFHIGDTGIMFVLLRVYGEI